MGLLRLQTSDSRDYIALHVDFSGTKCFGIRKGFILHEELRDVCTCCLLVATAPSNMITVGGVMTDHAY